MTFTVGDDVRVNWPGNYLHGKFGPITKIITEQFLEQGTIKSIIIRIYVDRVYVQPSSIIPIDVFKIGDKVKFRRDLGKLPARNSLTIVVPFTTGTVCGISGLSDVYVLPSNGKRDLYNPEFLEKIIDDSETDDDMPELYASESDDDDMPPLIDCDDAIVDNSNRIKPIEFKSGRNLESRLIDRLRHEDQEKVWQNVLKLLEKRNNHFQLTYHAPPMGSIDYLKKRLEAEGFTVEMNGKEMKIKW